MNYKLFCKIFISLTVIFLFFIGGLVVYIDPFFHYHGPRKGFYYELNEDKTRYLNYGIVKNFEYNALITGTSMTQNFRVSEFNKLYRVNAIIVSASGSSFKEHNDILRAAYNTNRNISIVLRSLDLSYLIYKFDQYGENINLYPLYLYNDSYIDDIKYILNLDTVKMTIQILKNRLFSKTGGITDLDAYQNWNNGFKYGKEYVFKAKKEYERNVKKVYGHDDVDIALKNIRENVIKIADEHRDTTFYVFVPPYNIAYWKCLQDENNLEFMLNLRANVIKELLNYKNIKIYSFYDNKELINNYDLYKDLAHYHESVNSDILKWMKEDIGLITNDNFRVKIANENNVIRESLNLFEDN